MLYLKLINEKDTSLFKYSVLDSANFKEIHFFRIYKSISKFNICKFVKI